MKYTSHLKQLSVDMFRSSFDELDKNNRWVKLGDLLPWTELEKVYNSRLDNEIKGAGNKPARMIIGACIIKHKFSLSDEDTISMIQENPYMQYLYGLSEFTDKPLFDPSLFTTICKRITIEEINKLTVELLNKELAVKEAREIEEQKQKSDNEEPPATSSDDNFHFGANLAIAPNINELEEKCQRCWAKHICSGGCPAQKLSLSRKAEQSLPEANCGIEKILSEFYLKVYTLFKQTRQCGN